MAYFVQNNGKVYTVYTNYQEYRVYKEQKSEEGLMRLMNGHTSSLQRGLKDGWIRATFIVRKDHLNKIKALAYWERKKVKEVVDEAFGSHLNGKKIKPPRGAKGEARK